MGKMVIKVWRKVLKISADLQSYNSQIQNLKKHNMENSDWGHSL